MRNGLLRWLATGTLLLLSVAAQGLALSDIELLSTLNEPLDAQVRLVSASQADLDGITVNVSAPGGSGRRHVTLSTALEQDADGPYIHITSREAVREPAFKLLLDVSWPAGRMAREYSLIIDLK